MRTFMVSVLVCAVSFGALAEQRDATAPPSTAADVNSALDALHRAIEQLQTQVEALKEENAQLRRRLEEVRRAAQAPATNSSAAPAVVAGEESPKTESKAAPASASASATPSSATGVSDPANKIARGMTLREARQILGEPAAISSGGGGTRRATWKGYRQGGVFRVISADIDDAGVIRDFTEAQD